MQRLKKKEDKQLHGGNIKYEVMVRTINWCDMQQDARAASGGGTRCRPSREGSISASFACPSAEK